MKSIAYFLLALPFFLPGNPDPMAIRSIENRLVKVSEKLYANKYETSNYEYRRFLYWLKDNNSDLAEKAKVNDDGWAPIAENAMFKYYFGHHAFDDYPVVNITHESAVEFCRWLTQQYNNSKKRKFAEVRFRLPTEAEWTLMARPEGSGSPDYPWGGPYLTNAKSKYLANFFEISDHAVKIDINDRSKIELVKTKTRASSPGDDGYIYTAPIQTFPATGAGLHNLSGNVAEMMAEKGHTKGGSWGSSGYYLRIDAEDEFRDIEYSPYVGFRYVMEVIKR